MDAMRPPEDCQSMAELRVEIDRLDVELVTLLALRRHYIDRAVDLKKVEGIPSRAADRVTDVLDKVAATASEQGLDPELVRALWSELIEWSIRREFKELGV